MSATETTLKTKHGLIQYFEDEASVLGSYNEKANLYEIREDGGNRVLWHKGHRMAIGVIETIPARDPLAKIAANLWPWAETPSSHP